MARKDSTCGDTACQKCCVGRRSDAAISQKIGHCRGIAVGLINLAVPAYGTNFMQVTSSTYPRFHASRTFGDVLVGTIDGVVDGAISMS